MKFYVVGDIHGMYRKFLSLMKQIDFHKEDYIVFLGDYGDRGKGSWEVLKYIYEMHKKYPHVYALKGNHEANFLLTYKDSPFEDVDVFDEYDDYDEYGAIGKHYKKNKQEALDVINWMENMPCCMEIKGMMFSHAGCNPLKTKQDYWDYLTTREEFFLKYKGDKFWFCGHTPIQYVKRYFEVEKIEPLFLDNNVIMMDTGSFMENGKISCYEITNGDIFQSTVSEKSEWYY